MNTQEKNGFLKKLFQKKEGGTFVGNLIRLLLNIAIEKSVNQVEKEIDKAVDKIPEPPFPTPDGKNPADFPDFKSGSVEILSH